MFFDQGKDLGFENNTSTDSWTWSPLKIRGYYHVKTINNHVKTITYYISKMSINLLIVY